MSSQLFTDLTKTIKKILKLKETFYYQEFMENGFTITRTRDLEGNFNLIPVTSIEEYAQIPYHDRLLGEEKGLNKLSFSKESDSFFLIHRSLDEIRQEKIPIAGKRPMVLIQDLYEALEVSLFFYSQNKLPLIGEILNPAVVYSTARQYQVDSLYMDQLSAGNFLKELIALSLPLKSLTIIDSALPFKPFALPKIKTSYIFSLPYAGPVAYICPKSKVTETQTFHCFDGIYLEPGNKTIITNSNAISNPIIRIRTSLKSGQTNTKCSCKKKAYVFGRFSIY